jgi:type VI secretion system protein ImpF
VGREPKPVRGVRAPLFSRLTDENPRVATEDQPFRILNREELVESIAREISQLLNTRSPLRGETRELAKFTIFNYGVPDSIQLSPAGLEGLDRLAGQIAQIIEAYEPRLRNVSVSLQPDPDNPRGVTGQIEGLMPIGFEMEPVSFPLHYNLLSRTTRVSPER